MLRRLLHTSNSFPLTLIRLALGCVMFAHGAQKLQGWFGGYGYAATMQFFTNQGIPPLFASLAIYAEFLGGLGLLLGFLSRIAAFGILCNMVVAVALVHARNGFFMNWTGTKGSEGFEFHVLALAMALAVLIGGAGAGSIDRALTHPHETTDWPRSRERRGVRPAA